MYYSGDREVCSLMRYGVILLAVVSFGQAQEGPCDAELLSQVNRKDDDRYRVRGDRCEGLYNEQVGGSFGNLLVASLTAGRIPANAWPPAKAVTVQCRYKEAVDVHIQAFPLQPRTYYRLDTVKRGSAIAYQWDTGVVAKYLKPANVGLVAWASTMVDGRRQRVYLPVRAEAAGGANQLIVVPPVDLREVYLTVTSTVAGEKPLKLRTPLRGGSYLANQRIEIELPPMLREGFYRVEVSGDRKDLGSVTTAPFLIYSGAK